MLPHQIILVNLIVVHFDDDRVCGEETCLHCCCRCHTLQFSSLWSRNLRLSSQVHHRQVQSFLLHLCFFERVPWLNARVIQRCLFIHSALSSTVLWRMIEVQVMQSHSFHETVASFSRLTGWTFALAARHEGLMSYVGGSLAGCAATVGSYPFDLLRTVLASQGEPKVLFASFAALSSDLCLS